jgi:hypothetical protein
MAEIFISHSSKDKELKNFLSRAFASTQVRAIFEEFDAIKIGPPNAQRITGNIRQASAVFVLLGTNVDQHTRDWVLWESGVATDANKDIWVLESVNEQSAVAIPHLRHYVYFNPADQFWQGYLSQIVNSYDDSHFLKAISVGAATGAAVSAEEEATRGALWGAAAGLLLAAMNSHTRPSGLPFQCYKCYSSYSIHSCVPSLRCPVCNWRWYLLGTA